MSGIIRDENKGEKRVPSHGKAHSTENAKYRKSLMKLKQQEILMERNLINSIENMKMEPKILQLVLHDMNDIFRQRQLSMDSVKKALKEITEELRSAKSIMDCSEHIEKLDINAYKQRLVRLSRRIQDFKESCQLQSLSQEQTALESELREFELYLHKYERTTNSIGKPAASYNKKNKSHDYKKIQDFHALIAKTGHTDNWSNEDHLLFLKARKKCSNTLGLVAAIQAKCPDLTVENIVNHEAKVYLRLREKQRSTVKEWRKRKEMEKKKRDDETEIVEETSREKTKLNITKKLPTRATNECETRMKTADVVDVDSANGKKELIRRWKIEREKKRLMDEEQSKILTESKLAAQEKRKKERSKRIEEALTEYRKRKSVEISPETRKDDSKAKQKYNPMLIKAFRRQDEEYTRKKQNLIARLQRPAKNQMAIIVRSHTPKIRDNSTVLSPTKVWSERCKMQDLDKEPKKLQYIKDVPRLYVQWRNKESMEIMNCL